MFVSRPRTHTDCLTVVDWVADAEALYLFTGRLLQWPLTVEQLIETEQVAGRIAWVVIDPTTGLLVGHFDLTLQGASVRLGRVIVAPEQRGQGIARVLVQLALDRARELGVTKVGLNVISGNEPAICAYERAGFRRLPGSERADAIAMGLSLLQPAT